jgi:hypothetical protein
MIENHENSNLYGTGVSQIPIMQKIFLLNSGKENTIQKKMLSEKKVDLMGGEFALDEQTF